ncbi:hypothetical protein ACTU45_16795 [Streptomyces sp. 24-1644]|uniref:hypothetical protein n=1 Tax=Streptomyces sp. 24-1644 TaxID=3457315 RepID=UPI003FA6C269
MSTLIPSGPARVVVRQHRRPFQVLAALVPLAIAVLVGVALWADRVAETFAASGCSVDHTVFRCGGTVRGFLNNQAQVQDVQGWGGLLMLVLPAVVGAFVAGPMIARELESGTNRLAWSQSVSPARWLAAKLAVPAVLTLIVTTVLSAAFAWFWSTTDSPVYENRWSDRAVYGAIGAVPVAYALFGLALGALAGLLVRRTVVAMSVTVLATGLVVQILNTVRNSLWPVRTDIYVQNDNYRYPIDGATVEQGFVNSGGERLPNDICAKMQTDHEGCLADYDVTSRYLDYHPASHFWPLQLVETGILLALAALAVALAFRVLRRLHS